MAKMIDRPFPSPPSRDTPIGVQRKRTKGSKLPPNTVCVDRSTPWGNEFGWQLRGKLWAFTQHRRWIFFKAQAGFRERIKRELRGKNLACYCRLDEPCHRNTLLEIANTQDFCQANRDRRIGQKKR